MSSEAPEPPDHTWRHDFGDLGDKGPRAAAELVDLLDGTGHFLPDGGSFRVWARQSEERPGVVELGCFDLAGVEPAEAAGLGSDNSGMVACDIRAWILSGDPVAPWRNPALAAHPPALELSREWRERNRELKKRRKGEGDEQAGR
ncbi:hypothetical protein GX411_03745 [Candidatus Fermentibacteria bacterium]|nr:hypothetical protein [Candidatus Fermentibacteria bacterium]